MDYFKYLFNEDEWTLYLIDDDDTTITDEHIAAEVRFEEKEIYFRKGSLSLDTVMHELWHVYFKYCYLQDTADLSLSDMEEVTASLFADKGEKIITRAKEILIKLEKLKDDQ